jgi:hypothetical protein
MTSQNTDLSYWDILYVCVPIYMCVYIEERNFEFTWPDAGRVVHDNMTDEQ